MTITKRISTVHTTMSAARKIEYIAIHYSAGTTSKAGSALNTANYFATTDREVSSDFIVDDTAIVQYNPDIKNRYSWCVGGSKLNTKGGKLYGVAKNCNTISIEVCSNNSAGKITQPNDKYWSFSDAAVDNTVALVKYLMSEYNISADRVIRHYDVTGKLCPGIIGWNEDSNDVTAWNAFKARLTISASPAKYFVQVGAFGSKANAEKYLAEVKKTFPNAFIKTE